MADIIQLRRDTAANWASANPILAQGEPGIELDTDNLKWGDGSTAWNSLNYAILATQADNTILANFSGGAAVPTAVAVGEHVESLLESADAAAARSAIGAVGAGLAFTVIGFGAFGYRSSVLVTDFVAGGTLSRTETGRYFFTFDSSEPDTNYALVGSAAVIEAEATSRAARSVSPRNRTVTSVEIYTAHTLAADMELVTFWIIRA